MSKESSISIEELKNEEAVELILELINKYKILDGVDIGVYRSRGLYVIKLKPKDSHIFKVIDPVFDGKKYSYKNKDYSFKVSWPREV